MADKYHSMKELYTFEPMENYRLTSRRRPDSGVLILSPHGGGIEFLTSEIAREVARKAEQAKRDAERPRKVLLEAVQYMQMRTAGKRR